MPEAESAEKNTKNTRIQDRGEKTIVSQQSPGLEEVPLLQTGFINGPFSQATFERHAALLGDRHLSHPSNASVRAQVVHQLQRDYGNQYVQRLVKHITQEGSADVNPTLRQSLHPTTRQGMQATSVAQDLSDVRQINRRTTIQQQPTHPVLQRNGNSSRSRRARPRDAPRGTKPIDQTGLDHDQIHDIKDGIGARPPDWVGISPEGHVITSDEDGSAEDHGPWEDYTNAKYEVPSWLWQALVGVALAAGTLAVIACYVTGPCTVGSLIYALGASAAALIMGLLGQSDEAEGPVA